MKKNDNWINKFGMLYCLSAITLILTFVLMFLMVGTANPWEKTKICYLIVSCFTVFFYILTIDSLTKMGTDKICLAKIILDKIFGFFK